MSWWLGIAYLVWTVGGLGESLGGSYASVCSVQCGVIALRWVRSVEVFGGFDEARAWEVGVDRFDKFVTSGLLLPLVVVLFGLFFDVLLFYGCR